MKWPLPGDILTLTHITFTLNHDYCDTQPANIPLMMTTWKIIFPKKKKKKEEEKIFMLICACITKTHCHSLLFIFFVIYSTSQRDMEHMGIHRENYYPMHINIHRNCGLKTLRAMKKRKREKKNILLLLLRWQNTLLCSRNLFCVSTGRMCVCILQLHDGK